MLAMISVACALAGCAGMNRSRAIERLAPPPAYPEIAERYNERIERLDRIWARAVVSLEYRDERDKKHHEQGEGHLQIRRPSEVAMSVGKLGETYAWLGADAERFWFFDKFDTPRVSIGRHENIGAPCAQNIGLPVDPLRMLDLMGVTMIPPAAAGSTAWSEDGRWLVASFPVSVRRAGAPVIERVYMDERTLLPVQVEFDAGAGPDVISMLRNSAPVVQHDEGGFHPKMASRIEIRSMAVAGNGEERSEGDAESESLPERSVEARITLHLTDLEDGRSGRGKLSDAAFEFDALRRAFAPEHILVLDFDCLTSALPR